MKPTNKLRFVRRSVPDPTFGENISVYKHILQQWWEDNTVVLAVHITDKDGNAVASPNRGEWRDIPIEEESK
jgi:hypothetical protein